VDHAGDRLAFLDQRDVDRELAVARNELLGAVERIDQPEAAARNLRQRARRGRLLGDHRDLRGELGERLEDKVLGRLVGLGDRRGVLLVAHFDLLALDVVAEDHLAGALGDQAQDRQQVLCFAWLVHGGLAHGGSSPTPPVLSAPACPAKGKVTGTRFLGLDALNPEFSPG
jgi:hypothetical protein